MPLDITKMFLVKGTNGRPGKRIKPKGLVIHWTANTGEGSDADNTRNYFNNSGATASAHYVVDDKKIVQCLPENEMAYHAGSSNGYKVNAKNKLSSYPNNCTLGIEICVNKDGNFDKTMENAIALALDICKRYKWKSSNLWRHYDITGKDCPKFFVTDSTAKAYGFASASVGWAWFKSRIKEELEVQLIPIYIDGKKTAHQAIMYNGKAYPISTAVKECGTVVEYKNKALYLDK